MRPAVFVVLGALCLIFGVVNLAAFVALGHPFNLAVGITCLVVGVVDVTYGWVRS